MRATLTVGQAATTTALTDTPNPSVYGQTVTFTATVAGAPGVTPTSTVTFTEGMATFSTSTLGVGSHSLTAVYGGDGSDKGSTSAALTQQVKVQSAVVTAAASDSTPVQVSTAGGTASVTLQATVAGTQAGGSIAGALPVIYTLTPIGPGTTYTCTDKTGSGVSGGVLSSSCTLAGVAVNVYQLSISIGGNYTGTGVVTVYDPSLGFTTGGGTLVHNGSPATFGFTAKYLKSGQIQGNVLYVEHRVGGAVVLKSNAMSALSIVKGSDGTSLLAYLQGKATVQGVGNYAFLATANDADGQAPSSNPDQLGLQVTDPVGAPPAGLTFAPVALSGGAILVPHQ